MKLSFFLQSLLLVFVTKTFAVQFFGPTNMEPRLTRDICEYAFKVLQINRVNPHTVHWGDLNSIPRVMQQAGYSREFAGHFVGHFRTILSKGEAVADPVFKRALVAWNQKQSHAQKVVFCFADCLVENNSFGASASGSSLAQTVAAENLGPEVTEADLDGMELRFKQHFSKEPPKLIYTQDRGHHPEEFATIVVHELSHVANADFQDAWIFANIRSMRRSEPPDELFRKNVRFQEGRILVHEGFSLAFEESRAIKTELLSRELLKGLISLNKEQVKAMEKEIWSRLHRQYPKSLGDYLRSQGVREDTLLEWIEKTDAQMQQSLERLK